MKDWQSQAPVTWDCKYHVVILPRYRRKVLYGKMRRGIGQILRDLCRPKDVELVEGLVIPPEAWSGHSNDATVHRPDAPPATIEVKALASGVTFEVPELTTWAVVRIR
jgi:hypothetical protein